MGDPARELTHDLHLLRFDELRLEGLDPGDVVRDLRGAGDFAVAGFNRA